MNHVAHSDQHLSTQSTLVLCLINVNEDTGTFQNATGVEAGALSGQPGTGVTDKPETQGEDATATRHHFSKVLYTVTLYSKCTWHKLLRICVRARGPRFGVPPALQTLTGFVNQTKSSLSCMSTRGEDARAMNTALVVVEKSCLSDEALRMVKATFQVCVCVVLLFGTHICMHMSVCVCRYLGPFPGVCVCASRNHMCVCVRVGVCRYRGQSNECWHYVVKNNFI